jgi:poly(3-hydroxybutyrate) depolymerase
VGCANTVHASSIDASHHVVTLGAVSDGSGNECRQYGFFVPGNLKTDGSADGQPAALLYAGNPADSVCGSGGDSEIGQTWASMAAASVAVNNRFIVIVLAKSCNPAVAAWRHPYIDVPAPASTAPNDDAYLQAVVADIEARWHVDPNRIYLGGTSSGGGLANGAACDPNVVNLFRGYAPNANRMSEQGSSSAEVPGTERCGASYTDFFYLNQQAAGDTQVPPGTVCLPTHCVDSFSENDAFWAAHMGCGATSILTTFGSPAAANNRYSFSSCSFGTTPAVQGDYVNGGQHGIGAITSTGYGGSCTNCSDYYGIRELWTYFAASKWVQ